MATPYQGITDSSQSLQSPTGNTDWGFLQQELQLSNQQYERGLQKVGNDYNSITSQQVTNGENKQKQQEYIQQIQEGLKKVSTTDLSLPQNVAQAENLYAPFWKDGDLLQDIGITRDAASKLQRADSDHQSKDEKIRNSYNPWSVQRQQYVLEDLKLAKRGNESIAQVQRAEYLPITDYQAYVDEQDKLAGFKGIIVESANGPAVIKETNGTAALPQLKTRYDAMIGSKFQAEFSQQGWVEHRQELDAIARNNPGVSREQLNQTLAESKYHEITGYYDKKLERTSSDLFTTYQIPIKALYELKQKQGGKLTAEQEQNLNNLENGYWKDDSGKKEFVAGQKQYNEMLDQLSTEREQFIKANPNEKIGDIAANPEHYYSKLAREATINKLADTQASNHTISIELNKVWDAVATHRENEVNIRLRGQELSSVNQNRLWEHEDRLAKINADLLMNGINPQTGTSVANPTGGIAGTQVLGENTTDQQHVDFAAVLNAKKSGFLAVAAGAAYGINGTADRLDDLPGIKNNGQVLLDFKTLMKRFYDGNNLTNQQFSQKPEERIAFQTVHKSLSTYLNKSVPFTYSGVNTALNEYISNELKRRSTLKLITGKDDAYMLAYSQSRVQVAALKNYEGLVKEEQTALTHLTVADKQGHRMLLNDAGTAVATVQDVARDAPTLDVVDNRGHHRTISPQEYASAYLGKHLIWKNPRTVNIDGKDYSIARVNGEDNEPSDSEIEQQATAGRLNNAYKSQIAADKLVGRFGNYEDRDKLNQSLQGKVAGTMPSVTDQTGKTGMNISYGFGTEKNPGNGEKMILEAVQPANYTDIMVDGKSVLGDKEDLNKILGNAGSYSEIRKNLGQPTYSTLSSTGQSVVRFTVNDWDGTGKSKVVEIPLSPRVSGELLSSIPNSIGLYVYNELQHGKILTSDDNDKAMGFKYEVSPDNADNPTYVKVKTQHMEVNPKTGTESWVDNPVRNIKMVGSGGYNPDMIMSAVRENMYNSIEKLTQQRKQYNTQNAR